MQTFVRLAFTTCLMGCSYACMQTANNSFYGVRGFEDDVLDSGVVGDGYEDYYDGGSPNDAEKPDEIGEDETAIGVPAVPTGPRPGPDESSEEQPDEIEDEAPPSEEGEEQEPPDEGNGEEEVPEDDQTPPEDETPAPPEVWLPMEIQVLEIVNQRRSEGATCGGQSMPPAPPVDFDDNLRMAAFLHSKDMADNNYFSHTGLDGSSPGQRMARQGASAYGGENIAAGQGSPSSVMSSWMQSPGHCSNLMNARWTKLGVGYATGGSYGHYWTQNFN